MKKKILIVGNSVKADALAKKMSDSHEIFITEKSDIKKTYATAIDIREDSVIELLDFVMEQNIDLTVVLSQKALLTNIVNLFNSHNQLIFAPDNETAKLICDKFFVKKMMYKLKIPTPRFGIFEKQNLANEYVKNLDYPCVIKTTERSSAVIADSKKMAQNILDMAFLKQNMHVMIENYVAGYPFSFYAITDGYKAIPIGSALLYNRTEYNGQISSGFGACFPNYKLSLNAEDFIMNKVIYPAIKYFSDYGSCYVGILGVSGIISDDGVMQFVNYSTCMNDCDSSVILNNIDEDLYKLFVSCITGALSDDYDEIKHKSLSSVSVVLSCVKNSDRTNVISGLDNLDETVLYSFYPNIVQNDDLEYEALSGDVLSLTSSAGTLSFAKKILRDEIENISFSGLSYRKDILKD